MGFQVASGSTNADAIDLSSALAAKAPLASPTFQGTVSIPDGSAATPSLANTGDANTGLYFPADDSLSLSTAGNARVTIGSIGEIGINAGAANSVRLFMQGIGTSGTTHAAIIRNSDSSKEMLALRDDGVVLMPSTAAITTVSAANFWINSSGGNLARSTSSRRYKTDIEPLADEYADKALDLEPVWFRSTADIDVTAHPDWSYYGFIAEQVAQIDPRLVHWGIDEEGNPQAEGVQYDRLVAHLVSIVKRQQLQIDALTARLDAAGL
jgi:hypothetical protein